MGGFAQQVVDDPAAFESQGWGCTDYAAEWAVQWCKGGHFHAGIDIAAVQGSIIRTTRAGTVVDLGPWNPARTAQYLGPYAPVIRTDDGVYLEFGHVEQSLVSVGQRVSAGDAIARVGSLGASSGPHVHLEARTDGPIQDVRYATLDTRILDPTPYLTIQVTPSQEDDIVKALPVIWPDGHQEKFRIGPKGTLQHIYETNATTHQWSRWVDATPDDSLASIDGYVFLPGPPELLEVHCTRTDGDSFHYRQDGTGAWHGWRIGT